MTVLRRLALTALATAATALAGPQPYSIQPHSNAHFELRAYKTGLMSGKKHVFRFDRFEGRLAFDPEHVKDSSVAFTVDSDSIVCLDDWVGEKDRGKILDEARGNMLAVKKFPQMRFESTSFEPAGADAYKVTGHLTIRDKTQDVTVSLKMHREGEALLFDGESVVSLTDYGLKPPSAAFGMIGTKNEMDVSFALRAEPGKE